MLKDVQSPERLFDETALFLHRVVADLPESKRRMLDRLHGSNEVLHGRKVLVVDDDARNIFALTTVLENQEMDVLTATNGRQAIEIINDTPDLAVVLMDIMMPEMDGYETMREIRKDAEVPHPADPGADGKGDERRSREVPAGRRVRLHRQAGQHRPAAVAASCMAVPLIADQVMTNEDVTLLIVDDEPRNLEALEAMLDGSGCRVVRAQSADEALLAMLRQDFAAIILDIRMPGISGIDLAHLIKQRKRTQHVPILFLTAHLLDDEDVLRGYGVGAVDYLSKPVNANILRSKVAVFVELFRKTRSLATLNDALQNEIAERQKAQEALQEANEELELRVAQRTAALSIAHRGAVDSEERLRLAMEVAQIAAWQWDLATDQMEWSADPEALFGFPAGAFGPELENLPAAAPGRCAACAGGARAGQEHRSIRVRISRRQA